MPEWKQFEELAAQIYSELTPAARVTLNDKIVGQSGVERQIDVSVRTKVAEHEILIIIDAKDYSEPADIGTVDGFAGKVSDVRANKGVLICSAGFTSGARARARQLGIDLCNLHDARSRKWKLDLKLPVLWIDRQPIVRLEMGAYFMAGDSIPKDPREWVISADRGKTRLKLLATFERAWNERRIPQDVDGPHTLVPEQGSLEVLARSSNGEPVWRPVDVLKFVYTVGRKAWLGSFTPEECRGIFKYENGQFSPSYLPVGVIPKQRDESWVEVEDPDKLAVAVPGVLVTTEGWQIVPGTGEFTEAGMVLVQAQMPAGEEEH